MGDTFRKFISIVCVLALLTGLVPSAALAAPDGTEAARAAESVSVTADQKSGEPAADRSGSFSPKTSEVGSGPSTWSELVTAIMKTGSGGTITLADDITADSSNNALVFEVAENVTLDLNNYTINRNASSSSSLGYVIQVNSGSVTIKNGTITGGKSNENGGGIYVTGGELTLSNVTVTGNHSGNGGGIRVESGTLTMQNSNVTNNTATYGGGIYVGSNGTLNMSGGSIANNTASGSGGGIYSNYGAVNLSGGSIADNSSSDNGGGVYMNGGNIVMSGGSVTGNTSTYLGGGIFLNSSEMQLSGGTISNNTANNEKFKGIYVENKFSLKLSNNSTITVDRLYLPSGKTLTVSEAPAADSEIHVMLETIPSMGNPIVIAESETNCSSSFVVDNNNLPENTELVWKNNQIILRCFSTVITSWEELQDALDRGGNLQSDNTYMLQLTQDLTAESSDNTLVFAYTQHPVVLDLNGHTIDRNLTAATENGNVLTVTAGNLIVRDSSAAKTGRITGGNSSAAGGGVVVNGGSFTLESGTITGNTTGNAGGGVVVNGGSFTMSGGSLDTNIATYGSGVFLNGGSFTMQDGTLTGNTVGNQPDGNCCVVYAQNNASIQLSGGTIQDNKDWSPNLYRSFIYFDDTSSLTLTENSGPTVTDGIKLADGQFIKITGPLATWAKINIVAAGTPTPGHPVKIAESVDDCIANLVIENQPENTELVWVNGEILLRDKSDITTWAELQQALNDGGTWVGEEPEDYYIIRLSNDVTATGTDSALTFSYVGHDVILDLNGHTINRNLSAAAAADNGNVLTVESGVLFLSDSVGGGSITGGNNTASGGGVVVNDGRLFVDVGITGNKSQNNGGGVHVNDGSFTLEGGSVTDNTAEYDGGGIDVDSGSVTLLSGNINNNTARDNTSKGINLSSNGALTLSGSSASIVTDNIYLPRNKTITVNGSPAAGSDIQVWSQDMPFIGDPVTIAEAAQEWTEYFAVSNKPENAELIWTENKIILQTKPEVTSWGDLQKALTAGGTLERQGTEDYYIVRLANDVAPGDNESALEFNYTGHDVILDLNGHTIDRNLAGQESEYDSVLNVQGGNLILRDSGNGGKITGGFAVSNGVVNIREGATFTMEGGSITGNQAAAYGGIYVDHGGALNLKGGNISGNTTYSPQARGRGIYVNSTATLTLYNSSAITVTDSVYLPGNKTIQIRSTPADGSDILVALDHEPTIGNPVAIADSETNCAANFRVENQPANTEIVWENGQVKLITEGVKGWAALQAALNAGGTETPDGFIIQLGGDVGAEPDDRCLTFNYENHPVILDLNGHTINRNLSVPTESGNVLNVYSGKLTFRDSKGGGQITGGNNSSYGAGGVNLHGGIFTMEGGSITGNAKQGNNGHGGGVYMDGGTFNLKGGSITGNSTSEILGGGVYVNGGTFTVSGSPTVTGNDNGNSNIYLAQNYNISLGGELTEGASLGIGAGYEGTFAPDAQYEGVVETGFFTADSGYRLYKDSAGHPAIESENHNPGNPTWEWAMDLSAATLSVVCKNCGETIWSETGTVTIGYDAQAGKLQAVATATHDEQTYTETKDLTKYLIRHEAKEPAIDEDGTYTSGTQAYYELTAGDKKYYYTEVDGHPGEPCDPSTLKLDTFVFGATSQNNGIIEKYIGSFGTEKTEIDLPSRIVNTVDQSTQYVPLKMLGNSVDVFYTLPEPTETPAPSPAPVEITDRGSITNVSAGAFAGLSNLTLTLNAEEPITIANGAFTGCDNVTIRVMDVSGLKEGLHDDATGKYTVELIDGHHYEVTATTWAEDYSTADITITCSVCGDTHTFPAQVTKTETATEDPETHEKTYTLSIKAEGIYDGQTYSVELNKVPFFNVTVQGTEGTLRMPKVRNADNTGYTDYAVFTVKQDMLDRLSPPAGAVLAGLYDGIRIYGVGTRVEIRQDTNFTAGWRSVWARVQDALSEGKEITLYSDISPAQGDSYLYVPQGVTATLDLNGHTVNRGLSTAADNGYVIRVDGSLTLNNGTVIGGNNTGDGGGIYLFDGGSLITNNVTVSSNHAQNGGGVYMVDFSQAEFNNSTISYNVANQYGGGLYVGGERPSSNSGLLGDPSGSTNAKLLNVSIVNNRAQNAGGLFVNSGEVQLGSNTKIINNTDLNGGKFNNIDVVGGIMNLISGAKGLLLGLPIAGSVSSLKGWALGLLGALAAGGILAAVVCDRDKTSSDDDQEKECESHILRCELKWANDYSSVKEYVRCSECGKILEINDLEPTISIAEDMYTHYKVTPKYPTTDDTDQKVPPYTLVKQANIPEVIDTTDTAGDFIDDVELIPHGKGESKTVVLGSSPWKFVENGDKLKFDDWLWNNSKVTAVTFTGPDNQTITVQVHWLLPYGYAPHDSTEDPAKGSHPFQPESNENPKYVEIGTQETVKENQWTRLLYKFTAWRVPVYVKIVKEGTLYKLVYTYSEVDTEEIADKKKPGDQLKITGPVILRAEWQSKWKDLAETLKKEHAFAMTEPVTATLMDDTIKIEGNSASFLSLNSMILNGKTGPKVQSVLNVVGILTITDPVPTSGTIGGMITGGHTTANGGGITVGSDGTLTLQGGNIVSNEAQMLNDKTGNGGGVSVSGNFIMSGGSVRNNTAGNNGGGVYIANNAVFSMSGGEISGNRAGINDQNAKGGGVYVGGSFEVSGKVIIKDNKIGDTASNVYLPEGKTITVSGRLDNDARIHVSMQTPGVITSGLNAKGGDNARGKAENFVSDDENYKVIITDAGEAKLVDKDAKPKFNKARLELGGILRMRFYVELPEGWETENDRIDFSLKDMEPLSYAYSEYQTDYEGNYFVCPVNAYQMADTITAKYYHGDEEVATYTYTVKDYLRTLMSPSTNEQTAINLATATANYGHYIQPYLAATNGWTVGEDYAEMDLYDGTHFKYDENPDVDGSYKYVFNTTQAYSLKVAKTEFYLTLDSDTLLNVRVYLRNSEGTVTGKVGDKELKQWNRGGNSVVICLEGIPANALGTPYTFECFVDGGKVFDLSISALSIVNLALKNGGASDEERMAFTALYNYAMAAKDYTP